MIHWPLTPGHAAHYDPLEQVQPVGPFEHDDPGHRADPAMPNLLTAGVKTVELSPHCGTELLNVQIVSGKLVRPAEEICEMLTLLLLQSNLSDAGLDEMALLCAQRGCLVFRNQEFTDLGFEKQKKIASYAQLRAFHWA